MFLIMVINELNKKYVLRPNLKMFLILLHQFGQELVLFVELQIGCKPNQAPQFWNQCSSMDQVCSYWLLHCFLCESLCWSTIFTRTRKSRSNQNWSEILNKNLFEIFDLKLNQKFINIVLENGVVSNELWTVACLMIRVRAGQSFYTWYSAEKKRERLQSAPGKFGIKKWELFVVYNCSCEDPILGISLGYIQEPASSNNQTLLRALKCKKKKESINKVC